MLCETIFHRNEKKEDGNKSDYYPRTQLNDALIAFHAGRNSRANELRLVIDGLNRLTMPAVFVGF
jgi:hypothetical protein